MKKAILIVSLFLAAIDLCAQNNTYPGVRLSLNNDTGFFHSGDTAIVYANLRESVQEDLYISIKENGKYIKSNERLNLKFGDETIVHKQICQGPSSVVICIAPKQSKQTSQVGYIVDSEKFRPGFEYPSDFEKFWADQLKQLRKCKMDVKLTPVNDIPSKFRGQVESYAIEINMPEGRPVHGFISYPYGAKKKSCPIVIRTHGAGYSISSLWPTMDDAVKYKAISIDLNAHGYPDIKEIADSLGKTELKDYKNRKVTDHKSFYFRLMYLRDVRALDYATSLPIWDGRRILAMGGSQGGGQSLAIAGIDKRVTAVRASVPAMTDMGGIFAGHSGGWPKYYISMAKGDNLEAEKKILPYYDGANFAHCFKGRLWMVAGMVDSVCPPECVISAFNVSGSTNKKLFAFPYRPHGSTTIHDYLKEEQKNKISDVIEMEIKEYLTCGK